MKTPDEPTRGLNRDGEDGAGSGREPAPERPLRIRDVRVVITAPEGINLVVVKVETEEPGLNGLGCATFCYRHHAVRAFVEKHLRPLLIGRDAQRIEELWRLMHLNAYWRNGGVENNAISGIDMALWDIKAKRAGMPLYQLLGGKVREAARVYRHADGSSFTDVLHRAQALRETGVTHVRLQLRGYGGAEVGEEDRVGRLDGVYFDPARYRRQTLELFEQARSALGPEIELLHDVHERLEPADTVRFAADLEPFRLFWLEDPLAIEHLEWFPRLRAAGRTPIAMGELFNHPLEWGAVINGRWADFLRMHLSQMGGLTPARKVAAWAEQAGVRTAWHGPGDQSPVGHAVNLHLNLVTPNFGIQEFAGFGANTREVFPGWPVQQRGCLWAHEDRNGHGIELDEAAAARFPEVDQITTWTQTRLRDGNLTPP
jgi:mannonate dehydratase